jgi:hypothetical protein
MTEAASYRSILGELFKRRVLILESGKEEIAWGSGEKKDRMNICLKIARKNIELLRGLVFRKIDYCPNE